MRVLVLHEHQRIGERVLSEVEVLSRFHQVRIVCWNQGSETPDLGRDIDVRWIDSPAAVDRHWGWGIPFIFGRMGEAAREFQPDVIHVTHLSLLPLGILLKFRMGAQLVYDVYERHSVTMAAKLPMSSLVRRFIEAVENCMVRLSDCVLTVDSPGGMLEARYRRCRPNNLEVLYNVPPLEVDEKRKSSQFPDGGIVLVYVGGLNKAKGVVRAAESLAILHDQGRYQVRLLLIGDFQDGREDFLKVLSEHDLSHAVEIVSWIPYAKMMRHLRQSNIALALHQDHPKFRYVSKGTGRKFFTYMQAGLPIIAPTFWEIGQVVREERCGILVDTRDPFAIAGAVTRLIDEPDYAMELGRRGKRAIETWYNWDREQKKLLRAYEKLAWKRSNEGGEPERTSNQVPSFSDS